MRTTTLPSMLEILTRNYNFRNKSAKLYELGRVYFQAGRRPGRRAQGADSGRLRRRHGLLCPEGRRGGRSEAAADRRTSASLADRGESLLPSRPLRQGLAAATDCWASWARSIPMWPGNYGVDAELLLPPSCGFDALYERQGPRAPCIMPLPKFPAVTRDIAVVCDKAVTVGAAGGLPSARGAKGLLKDVALFDIYTGIGIAAGQEERGLQPDPPRRRPQPHRRRGRCGREEHPGRALEQKCGAVLR